MSRLKTTKEIIDENRRLMHNRIKVFEAYSRQDYLRQECNKNILAIVEEFSDWLVLEYEDIEPLIMLKVTRET